MVTKCYIIENSAKCAERVKKLEAVIPCFTWLELLDDGYIEYTISCKEEDVKYVEIMIAPFV